MEEKVLNTAYDTFTDILSASDLSVEDMDHYEDVFKDILKNSEWEEMALSEISIFETLHPYSAENFVQGYNQVVLLIFQNRKIIIDGNHRINFLRNHGLFNKTLKVILIDLSSC